MTPEQLQQHCAAIGYPWVAMDSDLMGGRWMMYDSRPNRSDEEWWPTGLRFAVVLVAVDYTGHFQDSLRGPKEAKQ